MDPTTYWIIAMVIIIFSISTPLAMLLIGWICFTPERMLRKVFPYIRESGNDITIFGYIIKKKFVILIHWMYTVYVIVWILLIALFNTFLTYSTKFNPYDGLDCFGYYDNGSEFEVTSEEQENMENVTEIRCYGWNFDIAGGIGHAGAIMTLSWLLVSIVLWIKLKLYYKVKITIKKGNKVCGLCGFIGLLAFQFIFAIGSFGPIISISYLINILSVYQLFDIILICLILLSGSLIIPIRRKPKSLAEYCKEAVENKQGRKEEDLEEIKNRLKNRVHGDQIQVDLLVELAELECKKTLADIYYYGIKKDGMTRRTCTAHCANCLCICMNTTCTCICMNTEDDEEAETDTDTISRKEMKIIAQVAYYKVTRDLQQQHNNQGKDTKPAELQQMTSDTGAGGGYQEDESAGLLGYTSNKTTYVQLQ